MSSGPGTTCASSVRGTSLPSLPITYAWLRSKGMALMPRGKRRNMSTGFFSPGVWSVVTDTPSTAIFIAPITCSVVIPLCSGLDLVHSNVVHRRVFLHAVVYVDTPLVLENSPRNPAGKGREVVS